MALRGNVATEPVLKVTQQGTTVCSFRLAVTARRYSSSDSKVVDAETSWYTVTCWRSLAENVVGSLAKGQGVVVHGRLRVRDFVHDGQPRTSADVTAEALGHDLTWGTTSFTPNRRSRADEVRDDTDRSEADELATAVSVGELDGEDLGGEGGGLLAGPGYDGGLDPARPLVDVGSEPF
ncbi:single-stranded DNA-binding protein [Aquipuribacter hungaricus]|uniref:single-stranded DNA-binding protein n=1 Tax=Aquipuribacter hungaricus TaxID=545624 RepID=UPI00361919AC